MLKRPELEIAVDLQARGYRLIQWLEKAMDAGFIAPDAAHDFTSLPDSAYAWMKHHYLNLPEDVRPPRRRLRSFANLFSTYLDSTFDLDESPGKRRYSPDAHCFCPCCSWLVRLPHLRPKKLRAGDKKRAGYMMRDFVLALAAERRIDLPAATLEEILADPAFRAPLALCAYAANLLERLKGWSEGPATLALWRGFAWKPEGSPRKGFRLTVEGILEAQATVLSRLGG
jgi:hypothetical protein